MVELTDSLKCLFTGTVEERGDEAVVTIPATEIEHGTIEAGASYRVALIKREADGDGAADARRTATARPPPQTAPRTARSPATAPAAVPRRRRRARGATPTGPARRSPRATSER